MAKIAVALSGGVDSAVSAYLLREQGHNLIGIFMKNWTPLDSQSLTDCPWEADQADAAAVCNKLGIDFRSINFEKEYRQEVVDYLISEYKAGRTPNPDVVCNRKVKFGSLLAMASELGCDYLATGHYAQNEEGKLLRGRDQNKDQSYFLWQLDEKQLQKAIFPIGALEKKAVREIAKNASLPVATKPDSQGICFIGHLNLKDFLKDELGTSRGEVYFVQQSITKSMINSMKSENDLALWLTAHSVLVGEHDGAAFTTRGERAGRIIDNRLLSIARNSHDVPSTFVVYRDMQLNRLYVVDSRDHALLNTTSFQITDMPDRQWEYLVSTVDMYSATSLSCVIRYRDAAVTVQSIRRSGNVVEILLSQEVWGVTLGQSAVLYRGNERIAGGIVCRTF